MGGNHTYAAGTALTDRRAAAAAHNLSTVTSTVGDPPVPRSRARRIGGLVAGLLVLAFLAAALVGGWESVEGYDWQVAPGVLAVAVASAAASLAVTGLAYVLVVERLVGRRLARGSLLSAWSRSMLARYVPGNVMMVATRVVLGRELGVPGRISLAASVYEQILMLALGATGSLGLLVAVGDLDQGAWLWIVALVPLGLVGLHPRIFERVSTVALERIGREPLKDFLSIREVAALTCLYAAATALLAVAVWATVRAFAGTDAGGVLLVGSGFLLSWVVSMLAFVFPSGLGVREGILALVLAVNLPTGVAIAAAAATRLVLTLVEIAFTGAVAALGRRRPRGP